MRYYVQKKEFIVALSFVISGCATNAEKQYEILGQGLLNVNTQYTACINSVYNDENYSNLKNKLPLPNENIEMLSNQTKPTRQEIKLLKPLANDMKKCRDLRISLVRPISVQLSAIAQENSDLKDALNVELIQQKISWGAAINRRKSINAMSEQKELMVFASMEGNLQNQHNSEIADRRAAAAAMAQAGNAMQQSAYQQQMLNQNQQIINNMNRPVSTSCNSFGSTVNCRSY